jgi:glycosyltransferase involved in cell wall biosynthesis
MNGVKRYEDMLYANLLDICTPDKYDVERIRRVPGGKQSDIVLSWFYRYHRTGDVTHATYQTLAASAYIWKPKKLIVTVHDLIPLRYPSEIRSRSARIQWRMVLKSLCLADIIIAISQSVKDELLSYGIKENKIRVVYQGVDHDMYKPLDKIISRMKLNVPLDRKYILVVSSNNDHKKINDVNNIISMVREKVPDAYIIKAGYGDRLSGEGILSVGYLEEDMMPYLYNCADIFCHVSESEGFGLPILEAMASRLPVVAKNVSAMPEVVDLAGVLVDKNRMDLMIDNMVMLLSNRDLRDAIAENCYKRSLQFSWKKTAIETKKIYDELFNK